MQKERWYQTTARNAQAVVINHTWQKIHGHTAILPCRSFPVHPWCIPARVICTASPNFRKRLGPRPNPSKLYTHPTLIIHAILPVLWPLRVLTKWFNGTQGLNPENPNGASCCWIPQFFALHLLLARLCCGAKIWCVWGTTNYTFRMCNSSNHVPGA